MDEVEKFTDWCKDVSKTFDSSCQKTAYASVMAMCTTDPYPMSGNGLGCYATPLKERVVNGERERVGPWGKVYAARQRSCHPVQCPELLCEQKGACGYEPLFGEAKDITKIEGSGYSTTKTMELSVSIPDWAQGTGGESETSSTSINVSTSYSTRDGMFKGCQNAALDFIQSCSTEAARREAEC